MQNYNTCVKEAVTSVFMILKPIRENDASMCFCIIVLEKKKLSNTKQRKKAIALLHQAGRFCCHLLLQNNDDQLNLTCVCKVNRLSTPEI